MDLKRFRQQAAGDILRGSYHQVCSLALGLTCLFLPVCRQLSADPNSLANLDQDLPNALQGRLPIYSLPEEWLWCETWCTDGSLSTAKSIDLCQNPQTKEGKLDVARRIAPQWSDWDHELSALRKSVDAANSAADRLVIDDL